MIDVISSKRFMAAAAGVFIAACAADKERGTERVSRAPAEAVPASVALSATKMVTGFASGVLRKVVELGAFQITKHPITRAQYGECVAAGACSATEGKGCSPSAFEHIRWRDFGEPESPQVCLEVEEAASYCRWIGGRLPTLPEWLLAARGPNPQRHAWGDAAPTCAQHPRAADLAGMFVSDKAAQKAGCKPAIKAKLVVGDYPEGAAASGMEDVLLTSGEFLAPQREPQFAACGKGLAGCFVYGSAPGAIEAVLPIGKDAANAPAEERAPLVYGFRCVLGEG